MSLPAQMLHYGNGPKKDESGFTQEKRIQKEQADEILIQQHQNWLENPYTQKMLGRIKEQHDSLVQGISDKAYNPETSDGQIRCIAFGIKTLKTTMSSLLTH